MLPADDRLKALHAFTSRLGLSFRNFELLNSAFCHTSYAYENKIDRLESYERLEFLGDAVLKLAVSDILYSKFANKQEGQLTEQRAIIVSDKKIAEFAEKLSMQDLLLTGKCEGDVGRKKESLLACSFEAFLGAIYLDFGAEGFNVAKKFLIDNFEHEILNANYVNPKAELQEFTQSYNHKLPEYVTMEVKGPAHDRTFVVGVYFENIFLEKAEAGSKKEAEFEAAKKALVILKEKVKNE